MNPISTFHSHPLGAISQNRLAWGPTASDYQSGLDLYFTRPSIVLFENLGHTLGYELNIGVAQHFNFLAHSRR